MRLSKYGTRMFAFLVGAFFVVLLLAGQASAQTANDSATCLSQTNNKWCLNSDGATGWCAYNVGSSYNCPAYDSASCSAQSGTWCAYTSGSGGWCATPPSTCPINDQASCTAAGRSWCTPQSGGTGWCTYSSTEKCPAYTETDCTAQNRTWCVSPGSASTSGWCTDSCPYSSQGDQQTQCTSANGKWCLNSDGATGWCSYSTTACPAYDSASCSAQSGTWCAYTSGSGGWCATPPSTCPINDQASCTAAGRSWCASAYGGQGWCSSAGMTCSGTYTPPTPTPTPTPTPAPAFTWPNTQTDCETYSGLWCKNESSYSTSYSMMGWCNMATQKCPVTPKQGYMTCWDNSQVRNDSICPTMPSTATDCKRVGYNWCTSTVSAYSSSSGWCSYNVCGATPPAGQMTCPDGINSSAALTGCPKKAVPVPEPIYTQCPDGTKILAGGSCMETYTCPNGSTVKSADQCPKEDEISTCLNKGYVWCKDSSATKSGWCSTSGRCEQSNVPPLPGPRPPEPQDEPVSAREVKQDQRNLLQDIRNVERFFKPLKNETMLARSATLKEKVNKLKVDTKTVYNETRQALYSEMEGLRLEMEKQNLLDELKNMERVFKSLKDETMLVKIATVREEINKLVVDVMTRKEGMMAIYDEMEDLRFAMQEAQESGAVIEPERDKKFQERALRDMKNSVKQFERFLNSVDSRIKKVEKQKIAVDPSFKDLVIKAKELVARAKQAKTYDEVKEIMDELPGLGENLNDALPRLEMLARLPEALKMINRRVAEAERAIKTTAAVVKRLKIDAADEIQKMQTLLAEVKEVVTKLKTGSVEDADNFFDYIQENVMEKLNDVVETANMVQTVANVKRYINKVADDLKRFERRSAQLEKKGEDVSEAKAFLDEAKTHLADLRAAATKKLNAEVVDEIIEHLGSLFNLDDQLEQILKLAAPDELERQLRRLFEGASKEEIKPMEIGVVEKAIVKAYQTANFFRMTPARSMAIIAE